MRWLAVLTLATWLGRSDAADDTAPVDPGSSSPTPELAA